MESSISLLGHWLTILRQEEKKGRLVKKLNGRVEGLLGELAEEQNQHHGRGRGWLSRVSPPWNIPFYILDKSRF